VATRGIPEPEAWQGKRGKIHTDYRVKERNQVDPIINQKPGLLRGVKRDP